MITLLLSVFVMVQMGAGAWWYVGLGTVSLFSFVYNSNKHDAVIKVITSYAKIMTEKKNIEESSK